MEGKTKSFHQKFQVSSFKFQDTGQTLMELLLALGIFAFIMTAVFALVFGGLTTGLRTEEQDYATMYAQEGLDAARSIRDTNWDTFISANDAPSTHGVSTKNGKWEWKSLSNQGTNDMTADVSKNEIAYGARKFTREIFVENVGRTANGDIFYGINTEDFGFNSSANHKCDGVDCSSLSTTIEFVNGAAKLKSQTPEINPAEAGSNLKALYHMNQNEGVELSTVDSPDHASQTGSVNADFNSTANYLCDGGSCDYSPTVKFDGAAARLKSQTPEISPTNESGLKALYHFNATSGAEANREGKELAIGDLGTGINDTDLKALWHLNENTGTTAADTSGNNNNGTVSEAPSSLNTPSSTGTYVLGSTSIDQSYPVFILQLPSGRYRFYYSWYNGTYWQLQYKDTSDTNPPSSTNLGAATTLNTGTAAAAAAYAPYVMQLSNGKYRLYFSWSNGAYFQLQYKDTSDTNPPSSTNIAAGAGTSLNTGSAAGDQTYMGRSIIQLSNGKYRLYYGQYNGTYYKLQYKDTSDTNLPDSTNIAAGAGTSLNTGTSTTDHALHPGIIRLPDNKYRLYFARYGTYWHIQYKDTTDTNPPDNLNIASGAGTWLNSGTAGTNQAYAPFIYQFPNGKYYLYYNWYQDASNYWKVYYKEIGPAWTTAGKFSNALSFDGVNDYVNVANGFTNTIKADDTHTIELWVYPQSVANQPLLYDAYQLAGGFDYFLQIGNAAANIMYWGIGGGSTNYRVYQGTVLSINQWHHIAAVKTGAGNSGDLYIDGILQTAYTNTGIGLGSTPNANSNLYFGRYRSGAPYLNGSIDEAAVYNTALLPAQITDHYNRGRAKDATVNNNDGKIIGPTTTAGNTNLNQALQFDGADDYVSIPTPGLVNLNFSAPATVEGWVKTNTDTCQTLFNLSEASTANNYQIVQIGDGCTTNLTNELITISRKTASTVRYVAGYTTTTRTELINDQWHHIAATFDGTASGIKIYIDGQSKTVSVGTGTNDGSFGGITNPTDASIGSTISSNVRASFFKGTLDEVAIWNRVLSQPEIAVHVTNVTPGFTGYLSSATIQSPNMSVYDPVFSNFSQTGATPSGTTLDYQISLDGCTNMYFLNNGNWAAATANDWSDATAVSGSISAFITSPTNVNKNLCVKTRLRTTDPNQTPAIDNIKIDYNQSGKAMMGLWHLNDGSPSTTAFDSSGRGNIGTLSGVPAPTWSDAGKFKKNLVFNGSSSYVSIPDAASLSPTNKLTVEAWVNQTALTVNKAIIGKWTYSTQGSWVLQTDGTTNTELQLFIAPSLTDTETVYAQTPAGSWSLGWHHVAFVYDGSGAADADRLKIYIDGTPQTMTYTGSSTPKIPSSLLDSTAPIRIGDFEGRVPSRFWNGSIDEVAVYNAALPATGAGSIQEHYLRGIAEDYTTVEANGQVLANDGTIIGPTSTNGNTNLNQALQFDGVDDYVSAGNVGAGIKTVELWINDSNNTDGILELAGGVTISKSGGNVISAGITSSTYYVDGVLTQTLPVSGWHHVAVTNTGGITANAVIIGKTGVDYMAGSIDEVAVWNTVLDQPTIQKHASTFVGYPSSATVWPTNASALSDYGSLKDFAEVVLKPAGTSVDYQLSMDGCTTMQYWDGSAWASGAAGGWNDMRTINRYLSLRSPGSKNPCVKVRLNTTDLNQTPTLDNIKITYNQTGGTDDPKTKKVTSRVKWPSGLSFQDISLAEYLTDWMYPEITSDTQADFNAAGSVSTGLTVDANGTVYLAGPITTAQTYTSAAIDTGSTSQFMKASWNVAALPAGTTLTLKVRSAPDNTGTTWTPWSAPITMTIWSGSSALSGITNNRWTQYQIVFDPAGAGQTPVLDKITIQAKNLY